MVRLRSDPAFQEKLTAGIRKYNAEHPEKMKEFHALLRTISKSPEHRDRCKKNSTFLWTTEKYRKLMEEVMRERWSTEFAHGTAKRIMVAKWDEDEFMERIFSGAWRNKTGAYPSTDLEKKLIKIAVLKSKLKRSHQNDASRLSQLQQGPRQGESQRPGG
jgi:hypothetical protein